MEFAGTSRVRHGAPAHEAKPDMAGSGEIRMLRLPAAMRITGLGKTKIYELQAAGDFPMRVQLTAHCVGWVERDVQDWLSRRIGCSEPLSG